MGADVIGSIRALDARYLGSNPRPPIAWMIQWQDTGLPIRVCWVRIPLRASGGRVPLYTLV